MIFKEEIQKTECHNLHHKAGYQLPWFSHNYSVINYAFDPVAELLRRVKILVNVVVSRGVFYTRRAENRLVDRDC